MRRFLRINLRNTMILVAIFAVVSWRYISNKSEYYRNFIRTQGSLGSRSHFRSEAGWISYVKGLEEAHRFFGISFDPDRLLAKNRVVADREFYETIRPLLPSLDEILSPDLPPAESAAVDDSGG